MIPKSETLKDEHEDAKEGLQNHKMCGRRVKKK